MNPFRRLALAVAVSLIAATACQSSDDAGTAAVDPATAESAAVGADLGVESPSLETEADSPVEPSGDSASSASPLGSADLSLPPALGIDELAAAASATEPMPTSISIERLGLTETSVLAVGVEDNGEMTVPPPLDVGWYRFGPRPGESGSAVLAGHVASDGIDGAFRHLDRLEPGDVVTVGFDDGSSQSFVIDELFQVDKTELPFDRVFARSGPAKLALITCGGDFDYNARSYDDNIVATAIPLAG